MTERLSDDLLDWQSWALGMCHLLDRIQWVADDMDEVQRLCNQRLALAKQHGMIVEVGEPMSGTIN